MTARPVFPDGLLALYLEGRQLVADRKAEEGAARWRAAAAQAKRGGLTTEALWLSWRAATVLSESGRAADADAAFEEALSFAEAVGRPMITAHLLRAWAHSLRLRADPVRAVDLGLVLQARGDLAGAEEYERRALALWEQVPPTLHGSAVLENLGTIAAARGASVQLESEAVDAAHRRLLRALAIQEKLFPDGLGVADCLDKLAEVARRRGDEDQAQGHLRRALAIRQKLAPATAAEAETLHATRRLSAARRSRQVAFRSRPSGYLADEPSPATRRTSGTRTSATRGGSRPALGCHGLPPLD